MHSYDDDSSPAFTLGVGLFLLGCGLFWVRLGFVFLLDFLLFSLCEGGVGGWLGRHVVVG